MSEENQNLFLEKDLIDLGFMDHIRFVSFVPINKTEIDKAIQEYNCLQMNQKKCIDNYAKQQRALEDKYSIVVRKIEESKESILKGVEECIAKNWTDYNVHYDEGRCEIDFQHGKLILEQKTTTKFKIKPIKEN